jgi:hypothetical protein
MSWQQAIVSTDGTHHEIDGQPIYEQKYDEVLKFHAPGLAPVRIADEAWHIDINGLAAYPQRFRRAFGYYSGLAAVMTDKGWCHIHTNGSCLYPQRYAWCGNFQEGFCVVRQSDGLYFHITDQGNAAYDARWNYAGDYRDGICVIQNATGRSSHMDASGFLVHGYWFLDLDVFHKGFARARDGEGWMHITVRGTPAYGRRFANVEPFYNGQARVERFDGGLEVISEMGETLVELRPAMRNEFAELSSDMVGFWRTQTIYAAVETGLFEALPASVEELATACELIPDRVLRLLRALAELKLVVKEGAQWQVTSRGAYLTSKHPLTLADAAIEYGRDLADMWNGLPQALRHEGNWTRPDIFSQIARNPARVDSHHRMLRSYARNDYAEVPAALALSGDEHIVDAGGGMGVLASMLLEYYPRIKVTLFERPEVIAHMTENMLAGELSTLAGDIFESWVVIADAVVMSRVLHDWDDDAALIILKRARAALSLNNRLFLVEMVMSEVGEAGSLCDLHLLMATGGRERTRTEYARLMEQAGFRLDVVRPLAALPSILIGIAI